MVGMGVELENKLGGSVAA